MATTVYQTKAPNDKHVNYVAQGIISAIDGYMKGITQMKQQEQALQLEDFKMQREKQYKQETLNEQRKYDSEQLYKDPIKRAEIRQGIEQGLIDPADLQGTPMQDWSTQYQQQKAQQSQQGVLQEGLPSNIVMDNIAAKLQDGMASPKEKKLFDQGIKKTMKIEGGKIVPVGKYEPQTQDEAIEFEKRKKEAGGGASARVEVQKNKDIDKITAMVEDNKVKKEYLQDAEVSAQKIKTGLAGMIQRKYSRAFNPNDPMLRDWQMVKMVLTDAQLLYTAKTKGAISDREMALFAQAAANDDIQSLPEILPVFEKLRKFIEAEETAAKTSFKRKYNEDPESFLGEDGQATSDEGSQEIQSTGDADVDALLKDLY